MNFGKVGIERDRHFTARKLLSAYATRAWQAGGIVAIGKKGPARLMVGGAVSSDLHKVIQAASTPALS